MAGALCLATLASASPVGATSRDEQAKILFKDTYVALFRLYNGRTGEHLYTRSKYEVAVLNDIHKWNTEDVGWFAPKKGKPVYRLYNPVLGDHHYTTSKYESDVLSKKHGWNYEGISWQSGGKVPVYRLFNPGLKVGSHHYTTSKNERDTLVRDNGWVDEGIGWYALSKGQITAAYGGPGLSEVILRQDDKIFSKVLYRIPDSGSYYMDEIEAYAWSKAPNPGESISIGSEMNYTDWVK